MGSDAYPFAFRNSRRAHALRPISRATALTTFLMGMMMMSTANAQSAMGWIELKPGSAPDTIQIIGHALTFGQAAGADFSLSVQRGGPGGRSNSQQSGRVDLAPGENKVLATALVNVTNCDDLMIELKLKHRGETIFKTAMSKERAADCGSF